jgi:hypothetical protein
MAVGMVVLLAGFLSGWWLRGALSKPTTPYRLTPQRPTPIDKKTEAAIVHREGWDTFNALHRGKFEEALRARRSKR